MGLTKEAHISTQERQKMQNETDFKKVFCNSVHNQNGYTFKIAMSQMSGLPDLYCAMPGFVPVMLEAKWIKGLSLGPFSRKIPYRPYQQEILRSCNKVYKYMNHKVAYCLLGLDFGETQHCILYNPEIPIVTNDVIISEETVQIQNDIDIALLFEKGKVPRLYEQPLKELLYHDNVIGVIDGEGIR